MVFCGIDPGLSGGIAFLFENTMSLQTFPMPVGIKGSGAIHTLELARLFLGRLPELVLIEEAISLPQQGSVSQNTIQRNFGRILATLETSHLPYRIINPSTLRKELGFSRTTNKEEAVDYVKRIIPDWQAPRKRTGTLLDGQSDAAALACHAWSTNRKTRSA